MVGYGFTEAVWPDPYLPCPKPSIDPSSLKVKLQGLSLTLATCSLHDLTFEPCEAHRASLVPFPKLALVPQDAVPSKSF